MKRRKFINTSLLSSLGLLSTPLLLQACSSDNSGSSDTTNTITTSANDLQIPPALRSSSTGSYTLDAMTVQASNHQFYQDNDSSVTALKTSTSNNTYLGPTIFVTRDDNATFNIINNLDEPITNHWHGLHIPGSVDGTPSQLIAAEASWKPTLAITQEASTNWYHSHVHGTTGKHVHNGHASLFIIEDSSAKALDVPQSYGVDDIPLIVLRSL